jgi:hypothetical protein
MNLEVGKTAFWDVDINTLDEDNHADFIITRIFQFGLINDLRAVIKHYAPNQINHAFKNTRGIDAKAIDLAKVLGYI